LEELYSNTGKTKATPPNSNKLRGLKPRKELQNRCLTAAASTPNASRNIGQAILSLATRRANASEKPLLHLGHNLCLSHFIGSFHCYNTYADLVSLHPLFQFALCLTGPLLSYFFFLLLRSCLSPPVNYSTDCPFFIASLPWFYRSANRLRTGSVGCYLIDLPHVRMRSGSDILLSTISASISENRILGTGRSRRENFGNTIPWDKYSLWRRQSLIILRIASALQQRANGGRR